MCEVDEINTDLWLKTIGTGKANGRSSSYNFVNREMKAAIIDTLFERIDIQSCDNSVAGDSEPTPPRKKSKINHNNLNYEKAKVTLFVLFLCDLIVLCLKTTRHHTKHACTVELRG